MTTIALAAATVALQPMTIHCEFLDEGESAAETLPDADGWDARIRLEPKGKSYDFAMIDGPPLFSSSKGLANYSGTLSHAGGISVTRSQAKAGAWKVKRFDANGLQLLRGGGRIDLALAAGSPGGFVGTWRISQSMGHVFMDGEGQVICRTLQTDAPTAWDNYRP